MSWLSSLALKIKLKRQLSLSLCLSLSSLGLIRSNAQRDHGAQNDVPFMKVFTWILQLVIQSYLWGNIQFFGVFLQQLPPVMTHDCLFFPLFCFPMSLKCSMFRLFQSESDLSGLFSVCFGGFFDRKKKKNRIKFYHLGQHCLRDCHGNRRWANSHKMNGFTRENIWQFLWSHWTFSVTTFQQRHISGSVISI